VLRKDGKDLEHLLDAGGAGLPIEQVPTHLEVLVHAERLEDIVDLVSGFIRPRAGAACVVRQSVEAPPAV
jgi:hypothetical protein